MRDPLNAVRPEVRSMAPYQPIRPYEILAQELGLPREQIVKLDANENPYGAPAAVRQALAALENTHIYPDPESRHLREALAQQHGVAYESIVAGAGADELIDLAMRLLIEPGDRIVICPPTFGMYAFDGQLNGAQVIEVARRPDFSLDLESLRSTIESQRPKLLLLATPNNPDGGLLSESELAAVLNLPTIVLLDEAYIEFADGSPSRLRAAAQRANLIVLRTFSKFAGLAGIRIGYGVFPEPLLPQLWKIKQPYNVSVAASQAGLAALGCWPELLATAEKIVAERERLQRGLASLEYLDPIPSQANFVLCRVLDRPAADLKAALQRRGIMVRHFDTPRLQDCIRISAGTPSDTQRVLTALKELE